MAKVVVLPDDIMGDILSRLPFKSLQRLRCVSKSSNSMISKDHSFARMQLKRGLQSPKSGLQKILVSSPSPPYLRSLNYEKRKCFAGKGAISELVFPSDQTLPTVVGSCHGLLCLAFQNCKDIYLWNPSTGDYNKLPDHPCVLPDRYPTPNRSISHHLFVHGFGYDSFSGDYKVLLGIKNWWLNRVDEKFESEKEVKFAIFSMRENCWRIIQQIPPSTFLQQYIHFGCNFVNGTLNWLAIQSPKRKDPVLVAFDLKTEGFMELAMPDIDDITHAGLGVLEGRLCLSVATQISSSNFMIELWVMNQYGVGQSWTRFLDSPFESAYQFQFPLCISKDNRIILFNGESSLTRLDADGERKTETCELFKCRRHSYPSSQSASAKFNYCYDCHIYVESLVSPNFT